MARKSSSTGLRGVWAPARMLAITSIVIAANTEGAPAPKVDTTPPGALTNVQLFSAPRGVAVGFDATGDDRSNGQATRYETNIWLQSASGTCGNVPAAGWVIFTQPGTQALPATSGNPDGVDWMDLDAGTPYCVAIRVVDDAGNYSINGPFAVATAPSSPSNWSLTEITESVLPGRQQTSVFNPLSYLVEDIANDTLWVVRVREDGVHLAAVSIDESSQAQPNQGVYVATPTQISSATNASGGVLQGYGFPSDSLVGRVTGVTAVPLQPDGSYGVAIFLRGKHLQSGAIVPLLLKYLLQGSNDGTWEVEVLDFDPQAYDGLVGSQDSRGWGVHMAYVGDELTLTYQMASGTLRMLMLAQQESSGAWEKTQILVRQHANKRDRVPLFNTGAVLDVSASGKQRLGIWLNQSWDGSGGMTNGLYLVRCDDATDSYCIDPATGTSSSWIWYDTGAPSELQGTSFRDLAAFDTSTGKLQIVDYVDAETDRVEAIHEDGFGTKFYGLAGAATSKLARVRQTIYSGNAELHSMLFAGCGYHVALSTDPGRSYGVRLSTRGYLHARGGSAPNYEAIEFSPTRRGSWQPNQNGFHQAWFIDHALEGTKLARDTSSLCSLP